MYKFVFLLVLCLVTPSAFAFGDEGQPPILPGGGGGATAPEPEIISLLGIGALAFIATHRLKK